MRINGSIEIIQYMKSLGADSLSESWNEENFNVENLFDKEPFYAFHMFMNYYVRHCPHPENKSKIVVCLQRSYETNYDGDVDDIMYIYKELKIEKQLVRPMYENVKIFTKFQVGKDFNSSYKY